MLFSNHPVVLQTQGNCLDQYVPSKGSTVISVTIRGALDPESFTKVDSHQHNFLPRLGISFSVAAFAESAEEPPLPKSRIYTRATITIPQSSSRVASMCPRLVYISVEYMDDGSRNCSAKSTTDLQLPSLFKRSYGTFAINEFRFSFNKRMSIFSLEKYSAIASYNCSMTPTSARAKMAVSLSPYSDHFVQMYLQPSE